MGKFDIDADLVRKLAGLLNETGLNEIEFAEGDRSIRLNRGGTVVTSAAPVAAAPATPQQAVAGAAKSETAGNAVTSPMVGTAYLAASPGGAPFIKVGDKVKAGDTLLIIEAMKVMNPIKAPAGGTVAEILVGDAKPVEFGETLVIIA